MSYREKGAWVYLVVTIGTYVAYIAVILGRAGGAPLAEVSYVRPMLWALAIGVVASTVGRTLVETARPSETRKADVRDRDINRFGEYLGATVLAAGMAVPLILAMVKAPYFWIANAIYAVFVLWATVTTAVKLIAYRRGF